MVLETIFTSWLGLNELRVTRDQLLREEIKPKEVITGIDDDEDPYSEAETKLRQDLLERLDRVMAIASEYEQLYTKQDFPDPLGYLKSDDASCVEPEGRTTTNSPAKNSRHVIKGYWKRWPILNSTISPFNVFPMYSGRRSKS